MSYNTQLRLMRDRELFQRIAACVATEGVTDPEAWVNANRWTLGAQPGWVAAYASAVENKHAHPGEDEAVITDAQILAGVQAVLGPVAPAAN